MGAASQQAAEAPLAEGRQEEESPMINVVMFDDNTYGLASFSGKLLGEKGVPYEFETEAEAEVKQAEIFDILNKARDAAQLTFPGVLDD
jgi:hypothetical protein